MPERQELDGWVRMRSILGKRHKGKGRGQGKDHFKWPKRNFENLHATQGKGCEWGSLKDYRSGSGIGSKRVRLIDIPGGPLLENVMMACQQ
jgi:hypothetical protein